MEKDFDGWNGIKKNTDLERKVPAFYNREVWWVKTGINIGVEIGGKHELFLRPAIIIRKFNTQMALAIPVTSGKKESKYYLNVAEENGKIYKACLSQLRAVSSKRFYRKIGMVRQKDYFLLLDMVSKMVYGKLPEIDDLKVE